MTSLDFAITQNPHPATDAEREGILANPAFGQEFTDHMVSIEWTEEKGWHDAQVRPYAPITLDQPPTSSTTGRPSSRG